MHQFSMDHNTDTCFRVIGLLAGVPCPVGVHADVGAVGVQGVRRALAGRGRVLASLRAVSESRGFSRNRFLSLKNPVQAHGPSPGHTRLVCIVLARMAQSERKCRLT